MQIFYFLNRCFCSLESLFFYLERHKTLLFGLILTKKEKMRKITILD